MRIGGTIAALLLGLSGCTREDANLTAYDRIPGASDVAHGKRLAAIMGCKGCHGKDLTGEDWSEPGFGVLWTANLTRSVPAMSDAQLRRAIQAGIRPTGGDLWEMPSHLFTQLAPRDYDALVAYLRALTPKGEPHPAPSYEAPILKEIREGTFKSAKSHVAEFGKAWPPDMGEELAKGRYIVRSTCAECHRMDLRGGTPAPGVTPRPDLRVAAAYSDADFLRLLRTGKGAGDRDLGLMSEVSRGRFSHLTDEEIAAVHAYLMAVAEKAP